MSGTRRALLANAVLASGALALFNRDAAAETIDYEYDVHGRLVRATYSNGVVVEYTYDDAGNRSRVVRTGGLTPPPFSATIAIPSNSTGVNLRTLAGVNGYDGIANATITFTLASNNTVTGNPGAPNGGVGIDTGAWPSGATIAITLQISGKVYGGGGRGGPGGPALPVGLGGDAINCQVPMSITVNSGGEVKSGGGGGGGGSRQRINSGGFLYAYGGGGGGGGAPNGPGGAGQSLPNGDGLAGNVGTVAAGGNGGAGGGGGAGAGGKGGNFGAAGANGQSALVAGGTGGAAGYAIRKNGHTVPVTNNGTITGTVA